MSLSTSNILEAAVSAGQRLLTSSQGKHLDIGSGHGELIELLRDRLTGFASHACDYTTELMKLADVKVQVVDLNTAGLPYPDSEFDIITCTEVVEHIEHYRETLRETYRVLRPGGVLVVTTPNVLNIRSRLRYLFFGFFNLFGPLHVKESRLYATGGHINPVSYFYLSHSMLDAGFENLQLSFDKKQRGSIPAAMLLFPFITIYGILARRRERRRYKTLDSANEPLVKTMNNWDMLLGRTIVIACRKPAASSLS